MLYEDAGLDVYYMLYHMLPNGICNPATQG